MQRGRFRSVRRALRRRDADAARSTSSRPPGSAAHGRRRRSCASSRRCFAELRRSAVAADARRRAIARRRCEPPAAARARRLRIYLKREDLSHTGAHKINNCVGQAVLARRMGKRRIIAETGAGQHGVATATVARCSACRARSTWAPRTSCARRSTSFRMRLLGAQVHAVHERHAHAQGRDERGAARLGHQRRATRYY